MLCAGPRSPPPHQLEMASLAARACLRAPNALLGMSRGMASKPEFQIPTSEQGMQSAAKVAGIGLAVMAGVTVGLEVIKMGYYWAGKCPHPWSGGH